MRTQARGIRYLSPTQKSMMLEDVNDVEFRKLRSRVSSLSLENKNLFSKTSSQKDQSESASSAVAYAYLPRLGMYVYCAWLVPEGCTMSGYVCVVSPFTQPNSWME